jgi:hypothetical protein
MRRGLDGNSPGTPISKMAFGADANPEIAVPGLAPTHVTHDSY